MFGTCPIPHEILVEIIKGSILVGIGHGHDQIPLVWRITRVKGYIWACCRSINLYASANRIVTSHVVVATHTTAIIIVNGVCSTEEVFDGWGLKVIKVIATRKIETCVSSVIVVIVVNINSVCER